MSRKQTVSLYVISLHLLRETSGCFIFFPQKLQFLLEEEDYYSPLKNVILNSSLSHNSNISSVKKPSDVTLLHLINMIKGWNISPQYIIVTWIMLKWSYFKYNLPLWAWHEIKKMLLPILWSVIVLEHGLFLHHFYPNETLWSLFLSWQSADSMYWIIWKLMLFVYIGLWVSCFSLWKQEPVVEC